MFMVKSTTRPKVGNPSKADESFYVNQNCISTACPACGKPLWKNLWRLWKTLSYQQDFLLFSFFAFLVEKSAYIHAYSVLRPKTGRVTSPSEGSRYRKNIGEKLSSCKKMLSKAIDAFSQLWKICEKPPKNDLALPGNTGEEREWKLHFPVSPHRRLPCREK